MSYFEALEKLFYWMLVQNFFNTLPHVQSDLFSRRYFIILDSTLILLPKTRADMFWDNFLCSNSPITLKINSFLIDLRICLTYKQCYVRRCGMRAEISSIRRHFVSNIFICATKRCLHDFFKYSYYILLFLSYLLLFNLPRKPPVSSDKHTRTSERDRMRENQHSWGWEYILP
jgi:hypothetical protein